MKPVSLPLREALTLVQESLVPNWREATDLWLDALMQAEAFGLERFVDPLGAELRRRNRRRFLCSARNAIRMIESEGS